MIKIQLCNITHRPNRKRLSMTDSTHTCRCVNIAGNVVCISAPSGQTAAVTFAAFSQHGPSPATTQFSSVTKRGTSGCCRSKKMHDFVVSCALTLLKSLLGIYYRPTGNNKNRCVSPYGLFSSFKMLFRRQVAVLSF